MIISKTPFRMSFIGGGTDMPAFYEKQQGAVVSTTIDRYIYISANRHFDDSVRVSYSKTENVKSITEVEHPLVREAMRYTGIHNGIEIVSIADIPSGTGMGSSSSFTVGMLNALYGYRGLTSGPKWLAESACKIEIDYLKEPIGKQDQYAAAFGGLRRYQFNKDGSVVADPAVISTRRREEFFNCLQVYHIGGTRSASSILGQIDTSQLVRMRSLVDDFWSVLTSQEDIRTLGKIMHEGWECKKQMGGISNPHIDALYNTACKAGALGGKLLGAGQNGFLLFFVEPRKFSAVDTALWFNYGGLRRMEFDYEPEGSRIIYVG